MPVRFRTVPNRHAQSDEQERVSVNDTRNEKGLPMRVDDRRLLQLLKKSSGLVIAVALTTTAICVMRAEPPASESPIIQPQHQDASPFMRAKLASSQMVLEGLVTEDFKLISDGASQMVMMSEAAEWPRAPDKIYDHYSEQFRRLASKLKRLAEAENLEGASFTHMHMTATCISCHEYVRGALRIAKDPEGKTGTVQLIPTEWPE